MRMIFSRISRPKHGEPGELRAYEAVLAANNGGIRSPQELIEILLRNEGRAHCTEFTARAGQQFLKHVAGFTGCEQCIHRPIGGRLSKGCGSGLQVVHRIGEYKDGGALRIRTELKKKILLLQCKCLLTLFIVVFNQYAAGTVGDAGEEPKFRQVQTRMKTDHIVAAFHPVFCGKIVEIEVKGRCLARSKTLSPQLGRRFVISFGEPASEGFNDEF